jgi:hypothetical protein
MKKPGSMSKRWRYWRGLSWLMTIKNLVEASGESWSPESYGTNLK